MTVRTVIVGGGIAGLAAAHRVVELATARDKPAAVTLLEAGSTLGGIVGTERRDGCLIERGGDSFLSEKPWGLALCTRLGLEERLIRTRDEQRRTFVVRAGRLVPLPAGFLLLAPTELLPLLGSPLFSWRGKLRMAADLVLPRRGGGDDESLASFVTRRLGREALERAAQPLAGGIYTADPSRLSLRATLPRFLDMEERQRSVILAMRRQVRAGAASGSGARWSLFVSFADGMQTLVDALAARLPADAVQLQTRARTIVRPSPDAWGVVLDDGRILEAEQVVVATPAFGAAALLRELDAPLAASLDEIRYASSASVTLAYPRAQVPHPLDGFGFVVPVAEGRDIIACTFASIKYPGRAPADTALLRVFCGGALAASVMERSDDALVAVARRELGALLGIRAEPHFALVHRYDRAMPQYDVGHLDRVAAIEARVARHPGLALAGAAYRGVGVPDCIHAGERAAEHVAAGRPRRIP